MLIIIALLIDSPIIYYLASPLVISVQVNEAPPMIETMTLATGMFIDADDFHRASGTATVYFN